MHHNINELPKNVQELPKRAQVLYMESYNDAWFSFNNGNDRQDHESRHDYAERKACEAIKEQYPDFDC